MREGWTYKKLGEICKLYQPKTIPQKDCLTEGKYPVYGSNGIIGYYNEYNHVDKEILIACRGTCGIVNVSQPYSWINGNAMVVHPLSDLLELDYLKYQLIGKDMKDVITGAAIPQITRQSLSSLLIGIPPRSIQSRIVSELDLLSGIIEKKNEQLKEYDQLAQSIFYDMFGDPVTNEKGWEVKKLGEVCEITSRLIDPQTHPYSEMFHVSPSNIISGTGEIIDCLLAKEEDLISNKYTFTRDMVLYSKIRPNLNKVATPNFDGICSADMYPLTIKPIANKVFIRNVLLGKHFLSYAIKQSGRARMPKINREALFAYTFPLPPLSLQQSFASKIEAIEQQKALIQQSITETETLFNSRMDYWFS